MNDPHAKWYRNVTRYQWLVLIVASLGWVFDAFEGQIFNLTRRSMLAEILAQPGSSPGVKAWGDIVLGIFLVGGTLGGWLFGMLADRRGRNPTMILTILFYSVFSGLTYFAAAANPFVSGNSACTGQPVADQRKYLCAVSRAAASFAA